MTRQKSTILYIDDHPEDLESYRQLLEGTGLLDVESMLPPSDLTRVEVKDLKADLYLIDYELSRAPQEGLPASYRGGTLANLLRETFPEHPMVLLTRPGLLRQYGDAHRQLGSIDEVLFKERVDSSPEQSAKFLICLVEGFHRLRRSKARTRKSLLKILGARKEEEEPIREAGPPFEGLESIEKGLTSEKQYGNWRVAEIAQWIRRELLGYPGIVYDELYAASSLGISLSAFLDSVNQEPFEDAEYNGVFGDLGTWWWRGRLHRTAYSIVREAGLEPPLAGSFGEAFNEIKGVSLEPSICIWSGKPYAETVCYILKKPVKREFALDYFPDDRPAVMDTAVVSIRAIQEDNRVMDELFTDVGQEMLPDIRRMKRPVDG